MYCKNKYLVMINTLFARTGNDYIKMSYRELENQIAIIRDTMNVWDEDYFVKLDLDKADDVIQNHKYNIYIS